MPMPRSIVEYLSGHDGYKCGYCGSPDSNFSHGMWAHSLSCQDYQDLIDRGWRRSGKYLYKPTMDKMCCPLYTIRCHASSFKISKSQKKVLKKATKFFATGDRGGGTGGSQDKGVDSKEGGEQGGSESLPAPPRVPQMTSEDLKKFDDLQGSQSTGSGVNSQERSAEDNSSMNTLEVDGEMGAASNQDGGASEMSLEDDSAKKQRKMPQQGLGPDPNRPVCKKAKLRRLKKKQERLAKRLDSTGEEILEVNNEGSKVNSEAKQLEEFIMDFLPGLEPKHRFELKLVRSSPMSSEFRRTFEDSFEVYKKYQMSIHDDPESKCTSNQWKRFLVDSPLEEEHADDGPECGYGSFHQHYILDGKIIAVGVIDILPNCTSSVYFYYDPEYRFLSLGTFSALRELAFTRLLNVTAPSLQYYYMGFYVHSCLKMRYKGAYHPSYLLCPEAYTFQPIKECVPKLELNKYSRFDPTDAADTPIDLNNVRVFHSHTSMKYGQYTQLFQRGENEEDVKEYATMAGKTCAERMLLYRN